MKLILLGPPGTGKGTQADILSKKLEIPSISTGDILREAVRRGTPVGKRAREYMDAGELVPDEVIIAIFIERIGKQDCKDGYILDGIPRTIAQAEALDEQGVKTDAVILIETEDKMIEARLSGRRYCANCNAIYHVRTNPPRREGICDVCGKELCIRDDDKPETVKNRLRTYHRETEPLKEYYKLQNKLTTVKNIMDIGETTAVISKVLGLEQ